MSTPPAIGRYEILEHLGHGAMGLVYRAKDPAVGRIVAVKTITVLALGGEHDDELHERFYREARAAGNLSHPGIVSIFDVGEHEGMPYLVMEFVSGRSLAEVLKKGERLPIKRVCEIGQQIAEALGYAHRRGVVHRDIKPANILLTSRETDGAERPKIADFGVAKVAEGQTTMTGQVLGTPAFMPPEQITGAPLDGRADLFSLGVVLYWMAVGELPFPGESLTSVSYKVVHTDPAPPQRLNPSIPASLEKIILKCLAKNPSDRYQTGEQLALALAEVRGVKMAIETTAAPIAATDPEATLLPRSGSAQPTSTESRLESPAQVLDAALSVQHKSAANPPKAPLLTARQFSALLGMVALLIALAVGGWFAVWKRLNSPRQENALSAPQPSTAPPVSAAPVAPVAAAAAPAPAAAVAAAPAALPKQPAVDAKTADATANPKTRGVVHAASPGAPKPAAPVTPVPAALSAPAMPALVDFDPMSLDPKTNSKLKIDADRTPQGLDFMIEMNGKLYFHKIAGTAPDYDGFFVPPGVQQFRVVAHSGAIEKESNIVSSEFQARKRKTLKIVLEVQGSGVNQDAVPQALYPDTEIVVGLK